MTTWTRVTDPEALKAALQLTKGCYQEAFIQGQENLSGSTLIGTARAYAGHYKRSRENLLARLRSHGVPYYEERGSHGKRILVLGPVPPPPPPLTWWDRI